MTRGVCRSQAVVAKHVGYIGRKVLFQWPNESNSNSPRIFNVRRIFSVEQILYARTACRDTRTASCAVRWSVGSAEARGVMIFSARMIFNGIAAPTW